VNNGDRERVMELKRCIDNGMIAVDEARAAFEAAHEETVAWESARATKAACESKAFERLEGARKDLVGWLDELKRLV